MSNRLFTLYATSAIVSGETAICNMLTRALRRRGWDVDLVSRSTTPYERLEADSPNVVRVRRPFVWTLARYLREKRPQVVMSFDEIPGTELLTAQRLTGVPEHIIIRYDCPLETPQIPKAIYRRLGMRTKLRRFAMRHFLLRRADAIIGVSDGIYDSIREIYPSISTPIHRIYNPLEIDRILSMVADPCPHPWFDESIPVIVSVCRLYPEKDLPMMLKAFSIAKRQRPMRLIVVGIGPEADHLRAVAVALDISHSVHFVGYVENQYSYMANADVFAMSSVSEGLGCTLQEAMICGTTIVSTDYDYGARELLLDGEYGTLVPIRDPEAMAKALVYAIDNQSDPEKLMERVREFDIEPYVDELMALIGE